MENELIIDGQVIDLSEKQESAEEVTTEKPQPEEKVQETEEKVEAESEQTDEPPEEYSLRVGDEEIPLTEEDDDRVDGQPAPQWVKDLRKGFKETQKENRELRRQLEEALAKPAEQQPTQTQTDAIPPKPTLESCDYDEQAFETALTDWHEKKSRAEQQKQQQQRQQQEVIQRFQQRLEKHNERATRLPVKDYRETEEIVRRELPAIQQEILIHAADEGSELIAYALGKNQQLRQRVAAETDPIRAAFLLGQISKQVSLAPKPKKAPKPEPEVRGGGADAKQDDFNKLCPGATIE
ncbi:phage capsid protein [Salmonella enterica subsp. enterica serovar Hvittingfoss]|uniref:Phage capsid protein n=3 Tax=Salmonella enterica TaxID=28901 RepID=A0A760VK98_SALER|nr:scaffolding protein [Salmonella enterica]EAA6604640.1 phage capsid protein [Salmonella enterica subsp. enterica]EAB7030949.1 phage capsid protein [Salmonella enterica subsp. enterica serovar Weltevreden]EAN4737723.1 phage capsid protein [Salmonella enterica subsp. enterica serovar Soerenga]EBQ9796979.1 phage capsid protein [Salmonella enterica subsp. enterica serovar Kottbus]EBS3162045.1 phage capsid protein [Salmonella enterica subsp. enterica serovar Corvallis]EBS4584945.1 phage capsid p